MQNMRKTFFILFLIIGVGSFLTTHAQTVKRVSILINKQKTVVKNKLTIKFVSLIEDSRCPTGTQCIQAGNAKIKIRLSGGKTAAKTFEINTGQEPQLTSYNGYEITLVDLNPKPANNIRINRNGYKADFQVVRMGK